MTQKNLYTIFIVVFAMMLFCSTVKADVQPDSLLFIQDYSSSIFINSNNNVVITGWTRTFSSVNEVSATIYLQRWNGSHWVTIASWRGSSTNDRYAIVSREVIPAKGYYYRVAALHEAKQGSVTERVTSLTGHVFYN